MPVAKDVQSAGQIDVGDELQPMLPPAAGHGKGGKGAMGAHPLTADGDQPGAGATDIPPPDMSSTELNRASSQQQLDVDMVDAAEEPGPSTSVQVKLPLDMNTRVDCRWRDGQYHTVRVVERRAGEDPDNLAQWEYYVHYIGLNRRMDEWVVLQQLDLNTVEIEPPQEGDGPNSKKKRKVEHDTSPEEEEGHGHYDQNALREHEEFTKVKNIDWIELGRHELETWYFSPFPPEYKDCKKLYFCEFSLCFFKRRDQLLRHLHKCRLRHPPGEEIYRNGNVCMFEVDGKKEKTYCQNLCFLAKLFLDHKTLFWDVDLFLFYVMCEIDERGAHITGYFSKEKCSEEGYNLACILSLPPYQRKGYGKFLISMSYELSKIEGKVGSPEKPLSDLGLTAYRGYWTRVLLAVLRERDGTISVKELADVTAITTDDIVSTLQHLNMIQYQKGQHVICAAPKLLERLLREAGSPGLEVQPAKIIWTPYNAEREYQNYHK